MHATPTWRALPGATPALLEPRDDNDDSELTAVAPKKPPLDAGPDGPLPLPPVPDASPPIIRDAGTPMK